MNEILQALAEAFGDQVQVAHKIDQAVLTLPKEDIAQVVRFLKEHGFRILLDITAVDRLERQPRFDVVYHLYHLDLHDWIRLVVQVGGEEPELPSVTGLFAAANWAEREIYDLFGVVFRGHPDLKRIMMPDDWIGHPLRKDYPLTGLGPLPPLVRE